MQKNMMETVMGAVVLAVAAGFLWFAYQGSDLRVEEGYHISGHFRNVSGISSGSDVRIGGIKVGVVSNMALDPQTYEAVVTMQVNNKTKLPADSSATVASSGLLGEKYIQLVPGGDEEMLADNGRIQYTQSAVNLEEMIGKFMFSGGGVDKKSGDKPDAAPSAAAPAPALN